MVVDRSGFSVNGDGNGDGDDCDHDKVLAKAPRCVKEAGKDGKGKGDAARLTPLSI
jgi:hypothetical protein